MNGANGSNARDKVSFFVDIKPICDQLIDNDHVEMKDKYKLFMGEEGTRGTKGEDGGRNGIGG